MHSVGNLWGRLRNGRGWGKLNDASFAFFFVIAGMYTYQML